MYNWAETLAVNIKIAGQIGQQINNSDISIMIGSSSETTSQIMFGELGAT